MARSTLFRKHYGMRKATETKARVLKHETSTAQIIKHYLRISDREAYVTAEMARNAYQGIGSEYASC